MRKNGSRFISLRQYRLTDLFLFAVILVASEIIIYFASVYWFVEQAYFVLTFILPITLLIMIRWGWFCIFYAILDGLLYCLLRGLSWQNWLVYPIGNLFITFLLIFLVIDKRKKIVSTWYFTFLFVLAGWFLMGFGRAVIATIFGENFIGVLGACYGLGENGLLSLAVSELLILLLRRLDGMWEDQKSYLKRLDDERKEKMRGDSFGDEHVEIDEQTLATLKKHDDELY